jgi:hypothetical protein
MPGLRRTLEQAQRLCGLERTLYKAVLDAPIQATFLCVTPDGAYAQLSDGAVRSRPARAAIATKPRVAAAS